MALAPEPLPHKHRVAPKILLCAIVLVAIVTAAAAIYALVDRRDPATLTPAGVDYNPATPARP